MIVCVDVEMWKMTVITLTIKHRVRIYLPVRICVSVQLEKCRETCESVSLSQMLFSQRVTRVNGRQFDSSCGTQHTAHMDESYDC